MAKAQVDFLSIVFIHTNVSFNFFILINSCHFIFDKFLLKAISAQRGGVCGSSGKGIWFIQNKMKASRNWRVIKEQFFE